MTIQKLMEILCGIIQDYMNLSDDQVIIYDSNWQIPNDNRLYVIVSYDGNNGKIINIKHEFDSDTNKQTDYITTHEKFNIDVLSSSLDSINNYQKVLLALQSQASSLIQTTNSIRIWRGGHVLDLSMIEGAGALRRFQIPVIISNIQSNTKSIDYFDKFTNPTIITEE